MIMPQRFYDVFCCRLNVYKKNIINIICCKFFLFFYKMSVKGLCRLLCIMHCSAFFACLCRLLWKAGGLPDDQKQKTYCDSNRQGNCEVALPIAVCGLAALCLCATVKWRWWGRHRR